MISKSGNADGKVLTQDPLAWRRQFAANNKKSKMEKRQKKRRKTRSENGQKLGFTDFPMTAEDRER